jgi:fatty acid desaturase
MATTTAAHSQFGGRSIEWPTVGLLVAVYATVALLVWHHASLPWWLILPIGAYAAALHSSLQHEALHGHPTRSMRVNEWLVFMPLSLWLPFGRYRETHLKHHNDAWLTDPDHDPESYYLLPQDWAAMGGIWRALFAVNQTLGGRMLIGPLVGILRFWSAEFISISKGDILKIRDWTLFFFGAAVIYIYVDMICGMPFWKYYLLVAYPGISLALVRSYCEHQAAENVGERTIIVEASPFWSLLFLHNNLHVAHHARPALPWYELPAYYRAERQGLIQKNNGYLMNGYGEIFRRYFFTPKEPIPYPNPDWLKPQA